MVPFMHGMIGVDNKLKVNYFLDFEKANKTSDLNITTLHEGGQQTIELFSLVNYANLGVIVTGGHINYENFASARMFYPKQKLWKDLPAMNQHRSSHGSCIQDNWLYVLGCVQEEGFEYPTHAFERLNVAKALAGE